MIERCAAHAFVADLDAPILEAQDLRHLGRVLRLSAGELVTVSDGSGAWRRCRYRGTPSLDPDGPIVVEPAPEVAITVAFSLIKGDRTDWAVRKLTEVGVDRMVLLSCARSVVRWERDRRDAHLTRLRRLVRAAAMQSRLVRLPELSGVTAFETWVADSGARAALAEPGGGPPHLAQPCVAVGPEGGWASEELASGLAQVGLGTTVLRTETAAVVAGTFLAGLRGGIVREWATEGGQEANRGLE